jgi:hypothetical protein
LIGHQCAGFLSDPDLGFLSILVNLCLRLVKGFVAFLVFPGTAQYRTLFQAPDDGVLVIGILVGHFGGFDDGIGQIALMPVLNDAVLFLVSFTAGSQQAGRGGNH